MYMEACTLRYIYKLNGVLVIVASIQEILHMVADVCCIVPGTVLNKSFVRY